MKFGRLVFMLLLAAAGSALPGVSQAAGQVAKVTLRDFRIVMPGTLPAGPVTFQVTNAGLADHNLEIRGQGIDVRLPRDLSSGQHGTLRVNLHPGVYAVRCPVPGHALAGMKGKFLVKK